MAFTDESAVREKFHLNDANVVPSLLVARNIDDAHALVLASLDEGVDTETPAALLVQGETLLAGAQLLRSLASGSGAEQISISVGGQRIEKGQRFASLITLADRAEREAWELLARFMPPMSQRVLTSTDTVAVLGADQEVD